MTINRVLAEKVLEHVASIDRDRTVAFARILNGQTPMQQVLAEGVAVWDQATWLDVLYDKQGEACGTAGCFAGWTALLDGARPSPLNNACVIPPGATAFIEQTVQAYAAKALGLDNYQASRLFSANNEIADLRLALNDFYAVEDADRAVKA